VKKNLIYRHRVNQQMIMMIVTDDYEDEGRVYRVMCREGIIEE